jgi:hypothetical protein
MKVNIGSRGLTQSAFPVDILEEQKNLKKRSLEKYFSEGAPESINPFEDEEEFGF